MSWYPFRMPSFVSACLSNWQWRGPLGRGRPRLYLSFDDGPHPEISPWVVDCLRGVGARARFFCVGENLVRYPDLGHFLLSQGHALGNHGFRHLDAWRVSEAVYAEDMACCAEVLRGFSQEAAYYFRPPYGHLWPRAARRFRARGYQMVLWTLLSGDFDKNCPLDKALKICSAARDGDIVVFHDSEKAYPQLKFLLPRLLALWQARGFEFGLLGAD